jgi:hypothetical protein
MYPLNRPEVMIPYCEDKIDQSGRVTDGHTRDRIRQLLQAFLAWTHRLRASEYADEVAY